MKTTRATLIVNGASVVLLTVFSTIAAATNTPEIRAAEKQAVDMQEDRSPSAILPTEEQLERGRGLLEKISHIASNIPLQNSTAVMAVFGFNNLHTTIHPDYIRVEPAGRKTLVALPADLRGSGFDLLSTDPLVRTKSIKRTAWLGGVFNIDEVCVSIKDVRARFGYATKTLVTPILEFHHNASQWPRKNDVGRISFEPIDTPNGTVGKVEFRFEYQSCAKSFGFAYFKRGEE